jgi:hypothetical protein
MRQKTECSSCGTIYVKRSVESSRNSRIFYMDTSLRAREQLMIMDERLERILIVFTIASLHNTQCAYTYNQFD